MGEGSHLVRRVWLLGICGLPLVALACGSGSGASPVDSGAAPESDGGDAGFDVSVAQDAGVDAPDAPPPGDASLGDAVVTDAAAVDAPAEAAPVTCPDAGALSASLTVLASGSRPLNLVLDPCNVYWTDQVSGGVARVAKSGGPVSTIAMSMVPAGDVVSSQGIAIDAKNVYWTEFVSSASPDSGVALRSGDLVQTSLAGGASSTIWSGTNTPTAVAVDSSYLYVLQASDVERVPIGGGTITTLATAGGSYGLAVTPSAVLWTPYNGIDAVLTAPIGGGTRATFAAGTWGSASMASSTSLAQDGAYVFWGDSTSGASSGNIYAVPLDGGPQTTLGSAQEPLGIAFDASYVYVTTGAGGTVLQVPKAGGTPRTLASGQGWPYGIAVDEAYVYWTNNSGGANSVMRIGKP